MYDKMEDVIEMCLEENANEIKGSKRKVSTCHDVIKVQKLDETIVASKSKDDGQSEQEPSGFKNNHLNALVSKSPKKRLEISNTKNVAYKDANKKFIYGNYTNYYGYRNNATFDRRLAVFQNDSHLFTNKTVLDIGCNSGFITTKVAELFNVKSIVGLDIDRSLINKAIKNIVKKKNYAGTKQNAVKRQDFPFNVHFLHGNYVLRDDILLEIEKQQFDVILCLSVTKWIQLNFGDAGLKQAFRRMFLQLHSGGKLILEAQTFKNYAKRQSLSEEIASNYKSIKFFPKQFTDYLLSEEVGFNYMELMGVPDDCTAGFKRPIQIFTKL
ncbi:probable RNA methyltransferase CG1239 [Teleopsis dalmanni]|uniref:probable RNA methyltransferase CG1239 n=1 Tax=Teleopsis dalmanni TaxID=139649 RepID=UPI000D32BB98|nr:probable RNA methyltransferase CG1239 [Teleopsis dalmanni]